MHLPGSSIVKELEAGVFETEYQPDTDYRMVFSGSSILEELKDSEEAVNILREYAPAAVGMMAGGDKESMSLSLSDMMGMPYMGFEPAKIAEAIEKIREIRIGERRKS